MQTFVLFDLLLVALSAVAAFFVARGTHKGKTRFAAAFSLFAALSLLVSDRILWANTGKGMLDYATCFALPRSNSCRPTDAAKADPTPKSEQPNAQAAPPAESNSAAPVPALAPTAGIPPPTNAEEEWAGPGVSDPKRAIEGGWIDVQSWDSDAGRFVANQGVDCASPQWTYRIRGSAFIIENQMGQRWQELVTKIEGNVITLNRPEQKITIYDDRHALYEDYNGPGTTLKNRMLKC
jgi:hypothetical protein